MARSNLQLQIAGSPVLRYGVAAVSFTIALCLGLLEQQLWAEKTRGCGAIFLFTLPAGCYVTKKKYADV